MFNFHLEEDRSGGVWRQRLAPPAFSNSALTPNLQPLSSQTKILSEETHSASFVDSLLAIHCPSKMPMNSKVAFQNVFQMQSILTDKFLCLFLLRAHYFIKASVSR